MGFFCTFAQLESYGSSRLNIRKSMMFMNVNNVKYKLEVLGPMNQKQKLANCFCKETFDKYFNFAMF